MSFYTNGKQKKRNFEDKPFWEKDEKVDLNILNQHLYLNLNNKSKMENTIINKIQLSIIHIIGNCILEIKI